MPTTQRVASSHRSGRRRWYVRLVAVLLAAVLAWHMFASFVWSSGSSPIRNAVGAKTLSAYMLPMFGQSWSVFAPNPIRSDTTFEVRAKQDGDKQPTAWYSISDRDVNHAIKHHVLPSRLYLTNFQLISHYRSAFGELNADGQAAVGANYTGKSWSTSLQKRLAAAHDGGGDAYMANARAINTLISGIAEARWGTDVSAVQMRTVNTPVAPYDDRLDDDYRAKSTFIMTGWRPMSKAPHMNDKTIKRMYGAEAGNE